MDELPEIAMLSGQMRDTLYGKTIQNLTLLQSIKYTISLLYFR
jgi:hypothetical protein